MDTQETIDRQGVILGQMLTIFNGMGYDFQRLTKVYYRTETKMFLGEDSTFFYKPTDETWCTYKKEIEKQIRDIESQRKLSFHNFNRELVRTPYEEYSQLLFIALAGVDESKYHPKVPYQYKHPSKEQKKLIQMILDIMPFSSTNPMVDMKRTSRIKIDGFGVYVTDKDHYHLFKLLEEEYKRQGLNQCFPYGETEEPDVDHPFPLTSYHLRRQLEGDRGGKNQKHFIRDLIYRMHFLMNISDWVKYDVDFYGYYSEGMDLPLEDSILQYPFKRKEASLIANLLLYFDIYGKGENDGKLDTQRILSLVSKGEPNEAVLNDIEQIHPSYVAAEEALMRERESL